MVFEVGDNELEDIESTVGEDGGRDGIRVVQDVKPARIFLLRIAVCRREALRVAAKGRSDAPKIPADILPQEFNDRLQAREVVAECTERKAWYEGIVLENLDDICAMDAVLRGKGIDKAGEDLKLRVAVLLQEGLEDVHAGEILVHRKRMGVRHGLTSWRIRCIALVAGRVYKNFDF